MSFQNKKIQDENIQNKSYNTNDLSQDRIFTNALIGYIKFHRCKECGSERNLVKSCPNKECNK